MHVRKPATGAKSPGACRVRIWDRVPALDQEWEANVMLRRPEYRPEEGSTNSPMQPVVTFLKPC